MKYVKSTQETIQLLQDVTHQKESILNALFHNNHHRPPHYKVTARKKDNEDPPLTFIQRLVLRSMIKSLITKIKKDMKGSYKTTLWGLLASIGIAFGVLGAQLKAVTDDDPNTNINVELVVTTVVGIFGLFKMGQSARDKGVSTEEERAAAVK